MASKSFIQALPKAELHLHLEGSVDPATLVELSRRYHTPLPTENNRYDVTGSGDVLTDDDVRRLYSYKDFNGFLLAFKSVTERLRDRNVVAVGIGGDEDRGPAEWFRDLYKKAAENGLRLTAHAGETTGPESVWGALNIGAERIGHGLAAARDPELLEIMAQKQVPVELCITSNLRTGACKELQEHPVRKFFDEGLMITLSTDDPAMFQTSLNKEYEIAQKEFSFSEEHLRELARNSIEASFLPVEKKLRFMQQIDFLA